MWSYPYIIRTQIMARYLWKITTFETFDSIGKNFCPNW